MTPAGTSTDRNPQSSALTDMRTQAPAPILRIIVTTICILLVLAGAAALARFVIHGPVTGRSLAASVEGGSGSDRDSCRRAADRAVWTCFVPDVGASSYVKYTIRVRAGTSCW